MDVRCSQAFLQEMPIDAEGMGRSQSQCGVRTFLVCFHGVESQELQVILRSASQHFEGNGNRANLFWIGKREIPGTWLQNDVMRVASVVAVIQFPKTMNHLFFFQRYLRNWMNKLRIPDKTQDKIALQSRVFTVRECEAMMLRYKSPVELDAGMQGTLERLRQIAKPETREESLELARLMGECNAWMEDNNFPDEFFDLPSEDLCEAVVEYARSGCASAPMLADGLVTVDRHAIELCDVPFRAVPIDKPDEVMGGSDDCEDAVDSCDELARDLAVTNLDPKKESFEEMSRRMRRENEPAGFLFYKEDSGKLPILTAHVPKQKMSTDDVAEALKERFQSTHGAVEPANFQSAMLQIAGFYRVLVDEGHLVQKARLPLILPALTEAYKKLFNRKAASIPNELKKELTQIVLNNKCKNCGGTFCPSDTSLYGSDAAGNEIVVGKKAYNTRDFCELRCEQRSAMFKCKCGQQMKPHKVFGWLKAKCPVCGPNTRPACSFRHMDNLLSGLDPNFEVKRFYGPV
jgi:hypothetical protein